MDLETAKKLTKEKYEEGHRYDGCTMVPELIFHDACTLHDTVLVFGNVDRKTADKLFLEYMLTMANRKRYYVLAHVYYIGVRIYSVSVHWGR